jgi:NADH dehydrogenase FAD-containing subunit
MAVGSTSNDFGTPGVKEFAIPLDTLRQAERFNSVWSTPASGPMPNPSR